MFERSSLTLLALVLALVLVACGGQPEVATPEATPTAEVAAVTAEPLDEPTAEPTTAPEPTAEPTEEPTAEPTATPAPQRVGVLRFTDNEVTRSGSFRLEVRGVQPLPAGSHYQLWLMAGAALLDLGALTVEGDEIVFEGSTEENLLANYNSALISVEPDNDGDAAVSEEIAYTGRVPLEALTHIRNTVSSFADNPNSNGFVPGAEEQARLALDHANLLKESLDAGDLALAQRHAEHVVNILDGEEGENFGDLDGDGQAQNPGDGLGVRAYLNGAKEQADLAAGAADATDEVVLHAGHVGIAADNALGWLDEAIGEAQHVIASDSVDEAQPFADTLIQLGTDLINGRDLNADGYAAPGPGEGAILTAYEHGVFMGGFEIFPGEAAPAAAEPPATEAPPEVIVDMLDFTYSERDLVIPVGTTVTWVNVGEFEHSATADDGSWDTGLYGSGQQASITFATPGEFPYYCILHGTPGGDGMAAKITVVEADEAPAPAPAPEPSATPEPQPQTATIEMQDFTYEPVALTVEAGTTVLFPNVGQFEHSATADDGSWDTGLHPAGGEGSITFDTPGVYPYYCILHGTPGGGGMAATITVEE